MITQLTALGPAASGLHGRVLNELGRRIAHGEFPPATVLPLEEFESEYGVSRSVIREAIRSLQVHGMVEPRHKVGTLVRPRKFWALLDPQVIAWRADGPEGDEQLAELITLREALEPVAARQAASSEPAGLAEELHQRLSQLRAAYAALDPAGFVRADLSFHQALLTNTGIAVFDQLARTLIAAMQARYSHEHAVFSDATAASLDQHERVVAAIENRDPQGAVAAATDLVCTTRTEVLGADNDRRPVQP